MVVIGVDPQGAIPHIDIVFDTLRARFDEDRRGGRIVGRDQPDFGSLVIADGDDQPVFLRAESRPDAEALVLGLAIELDIVRQRRAEHVQGRIVHAPVIVGEAIDQCLVVHHPDEIGQCARDFVGQVLARLQILDPCGEPLRTVGIDRVGEQPPVLRDREAAEAEIFVPFGKRILVEDQHTLSTVHRLAVVFAILRALFEFGPVEPVAAALGNGRIVLLDARLHLVEQFVDQFLVRLHPRLEPGVLCFEMGEHGLVGHLRIAGVAQPGVRIGDGDPVMRIGKVAFFGPGSCGGRGGGAARRNGKTPELGNGWKRAAEGPKWVS